MKSYAFDDHVFGYTGRGYNLTSYRVELHDITSMNLMVNVVDVRRNRRVTSFRKRSRCADACGLYVQWLTDEEVSVWI